MPVTLTVMPADCAVSEGLPPSPYLALLGVGAICGVSSGAVSGTASPESAIGGVLSGCLVAFCDLRGPSCECQPSPAPGSKPPISVKTSTL